MRLTKVSTNALSCSKEERWCLDRADCLSSKDFIEFFDCFDCGFAQHCFEYILNKHFLTKSDCNTKIKEDYKSWKSLADHIRCWESRLDKLILKKMSMSGSKLMDTATSNKIESLQAAATASSSPTSEFHDTATTTSIASHPCRIYCHKHLLISCEITHVLRFSLVIYIALRAIYGIITVLLM
ncbi:unnamed protein product [Rhizopus stolonifer]